ncbi:MAG: hypothetical protein ACXQTZ_00250, partial [Candidatus Alkanophagales archaeon]
MGLLSSIWEKISGVGEKIERAAERAWSEIKEHIPHPQPPPQPLPSAPPPSAAPPPPVSAKPPERMLTSPIMRGAERVAKKIESWLEKPIAWLEERSKIRGEPLSGYGAKFAKGMLLSVPQTVRFVGVVPYGVEKVIRKPSLLKKTPEFAVEFAKTTWHEAKTRPFEFAGEFVGSTVLLGAAGRVTRLGAARVGLVGAEAGEVGVLERLVGRATRRYVKPSELIPKELELPTPKFSTLRVAKTAEPEEVLRFFKRGEEVWHATPLRFEPKTVVLRGVSPTKGLYVAPKPYPKFA